jgi:predicted metal-binding transcription factor (methanogenesis marker protein 9)
MDSSVLRQIVVRIDEEIVKSSTQLGEGKATDYGDYKWRCGIVRGYLLAKGIMMDVTEYMENDDG